MMGTKEKAEQLGVSQKKISDWCRNGNFGNVVEQDAPRSPWRIPEDAIPRGIRTKINRISIKELGGIKK
jgi:predicted site-specific integrase-resolvase